MQEICVNRKLHGEEHESNSNEASIGSHDDTGDVDDTLTPHSLAPSSDEAEPTVIATCPERRRRSHASTALAASAVRISIMFCMHHLLPLPRVPDPLNRTSYFDVQLRMMILISYLHPCSAWGLEYL